jgi:mannitol-specific phosphotransferase system IIBC component
MSKDIAEFLKNANIEVIHEAIKEVQENIKNLIVIEDLTPKVKSKHLLKETKKIAKKQKKEDRR